MRTGSQGCYPLWRDAEATQPNVARGLTEYISDAQNGTITPERLVAYAYGILAQPDYVRRFWEELELPPPRLPITKDGDLFRRVADHGERLLYLHTYGERFARSEDDGSVPQGRRAVPTKSPPMSTPTDCAYNPQTQVLYVGDGAFSPVKSEVWDYSVSGLQVVKSWLDYRKKNRKGRKSSALDEIRPERWTSPRSCWNCCGYSRPLSIFSLRARTGRKYAPLISFPVTSYPVRPKRRGSRPPSLQQRETRSSSFPRANEL